MRTIEKYDLPDPDAYGNASVLIPAGAQILALKMQRGRPRIWAVVDPQMHQVWRQFRVIPTGHQNIITVERVTLPRFRAQDLTVAAKPDLTLVTVATELRQCAAKTDRWEDYHYQKRNFADYAYHMIYSLQEITGYRAPEASGQSQSNAASTAAAP